MKEPTQEELLELFDYKGIDLIWKVNRGSNKLKGKVAGTPHSRGYRSLRINSIAYLVHRLVWVYHKGDIPEGFQIDHIDMCKHNNSITNLRLVTNRENSYNTKARGTSFNKRANKWQAYIGINRVATYLGSFDKEQEAHEAYLEAKRTNHKIKQR